MSALVIVIVSWVFFYAGYRFYSRRLENIWQVDPSRPTPAFTNSDGVDYMPAKHWTILFGHHFASIAGAGPILGPVIAGMIWGWLPALLWIIFGCIFLGGVHDFTALMISIRHGGKSIADVAHKVLNFRTKIFFAIFILLSLLLVMTVFAVVTAKTLISEPKLVIPTFGLVLAAVLVGLMIYRWKWNQLIATAIGIALLVLLLILGNRFPVVLNTPNALNVWVLILLAYAYIASVLPVNIILQPRDYLSTFILFFGLFSGYLGLILTRPQMHAPAFVAWRGEQGSLWPMLCVIIACGAISGFHSLIAGGTTSKQIASERDAKRIGYGGMVLEGVLAVLALLSVTAGLYWTKQQGHPDLIYPELMKTGDWIGAFSAGFGRITAPLLGAFGASVAAIMLNAFVLTTLDSATRINRYITEELLGEGLNLKPFRNRFFSTLVIVGLALWLALGNWQAIWPIFGASNQLVAALVLVIVFAYMTSVKRPAKHILYPAVFMLATTLTALLWQGIMFFRQHSALLFTVTALLFVLALFVIREVILWRRGSLLFKNTAGLR